MRMLALVLAAAATLLPQPLSACVVSIGAPDPPPANAAERRALRQRMAEGHRRYTRQVIDAYRAAAALIEVEVLEVPHWSQPIRLRVTAVYKGDFNPGDEIPLTQGLPLQLREPVHRADECRHARPYAAAPDRRSARVSVYRSPARKRDSDAP